MALPQIKYEPKAINANILDAVLNRHGVVICINDLIKKVGMPQYKKILSYFTMKYKNHEGFIESNAIFRSTKTHIILPRFGAKILIGPIINNITIDLPIGDDIKPIFNGTLKEQQVIVADYLKRFIYNEKRMANGTAGCIFVMKTGYGKTHIAMSLIEHIKKKTLFIVPRESGLQQVKKMLKIEFPKLKVGNYSCKGHKDGDIIVMVNKSAMSKIFRYGKEELTPAEYYKDFGFVIVDEIHACCGKQQLRMFNTLQTTCVMGITATPDETLKGWHAALPQYFGPIVDAKNIPNFSYDDVIWKVKIKYLNYAGPADYTRIVLREQNGLIDFYQTMVQIIEDPHRNQILLDLILKQYKKGRYCFVFHAFRRPLEGLYDALVKKIPKEDLYILYGGATPEHIENVVGKGKVILITYPYGEEQLSIERMDTLILASPRRRKTAQFVGRIIRRNGDITVQRKIYDLVDTKTILKNQKYARDKVYKMLFKDLTIVNKAIKYESIKVKHKMYITDVGEEESDEDNIDDDIEYDYDSD